MTRTIHPTPAVAGAAESAFHAVARLRRRKPLHPRGIVVPAVLERHGLDRPLGTAWLDEPGLDEGVARVSRSAGLPEGWPDVWGLALRLAVPGRADAPTGLADLMLAGSFAPPGGRLVLALRRGPRTPMSCVLPYRGADGRHVLLGIPGRSRALPGRPGELAAHLARDPLTIELAAATPRGPWQAFGRLTVGGPLLGSGDGVDAPGRQHLDDAPVSFDPVLNPLPGLALPDPIATVRARAYAGARAGRSADPAALDRLPARR